MIHGFWNAACRLAPSKPATTPAAVNTSAFATTYTSDSINAREVPRRVPWPAINPDRIGIIGNTQGVNASSSPAPKNPSSVSQRCDPARPVASRLSSAATGALSAVAATSLAAVVAGCGNGRASLATTGASAAIGAGGVRSPDAAGVAVTAGNANDTVRVISG